MGKYKVGRREERRKREKEKRERKEEEGRRRGQTAVGRPAEIRKREGAGG